jgi:hypothetical protein
MQIDQFPPGDRLELLKPEDRVIAEQSRRIRTAERTNHIIDSMTSVALRQA